MKTHHVKLNTTYFGYVGQGIKNAEVRFNDRGYETNDWLVMEEWTGKECTGCQIVKQITGVFPLDEIGLDGWVLLCLE